MISAVTMARGREGWYVIELALPSDVVEKHKVKESVPLLAIEASAMIERWMEEKAWNRK